jgi:hypothetical protein
MSEEEAVLMRVEQLHKNFFPNGVSGEEYERKSAEMYRTMAPDLVYSDFSRGAIGAFDSVMKDTKDVEKALFWAEFLARHQSEVNKIPLEESQNSFRGLVYEMAQSYSTALKYYEKNPVPEGKSGGIGRARCHFFSGNKKEAARIYSEDLMDEASTWDEGVEVWSRDDFRRYLRSSILSNHYHVPQPFTDRMDLIAFLREQAGEHEDIADQCLKAVEILGGNVKSVTTTVTSTVRIDKSDLLMEVEPYHAPESEPVSRWHIYATINGIGILLLLIIWALWRSKKEN